MVTAENEEVFGVFDLVCQQETDGFERLLASVHVVAKEEVVGFWRKTAVFEEAEEIVVLTVNVAFENVNEKWTQNGEAFSIPQIFMGASSSRRIGWLMKISLAFVQRYLISYSWSCTGFPGLLPRTSSNLSITESRSISVAESAMA
jgi:hypothetical protein